MLNVVKERLFPSPKIEILPDDSPDTRFISRIAGLDLFKIDHPESGTDIPEMSVVKFNHDKDAVFIFGPSEIIRSMSFSKHEHVGIMDDEHGCIDHRQSFLYFTHSTRSRMVKPEFDQHGRVVQVWDGDAVHNEGFHYGVKILTGSFQNCTYPNRRITHQIVLVGCTLDDQKCVQLVDRRYAVMTSG